MSRGREIEIDERREAPPARGRGLGREGRERQQRRVLVWQLDRASIPVERELPEKDTRDSVTVRGKEYRLRQSELDSLREIGRFRIIEERDLQRFGYMMEDLRFDTSDLVDSFFDDPFAPGQRTGTSQLTPAGRSASRRGG